MNRTSSFASLPLLVACVAGCGAHPTGTEEEKVSVAQGAHTVTSNRAFAWASSATVDHTPLTNYSFNSKGGPIFVDRTAVGTYDVSFGSINSQNGSPQVVAYGATNARCQMGGLQLYPTELKIRVLCFTPAGAPVDSLFVVSYEDTPRSVGYGAAYGVCVMPDQTHDAVPEITYNPADADYAKISFFSTGKYMMTFTKLNSFQGTVSVTAMGALPRTCQVESFHRSAPPMNDTHVLIACHAPGGALANSMFTVKYLDRFAVPALPGEYGFAWSSDTASASYTPPSSYSWNTVLNSAANVAGNTPTSQWLQLPSMPPADALHRTTTQVTAYAPGTTQVYCRPTSWTGTQVNVGCTNAAGTAVKARHLTLLLNQDS